MEIERGTCAFCDMDSEYVLSVSDPAPEKMQVIDGPVAMPICYDHTQEMKQSDLNQRRAENGTEPADSVDGERE